MSYNLTIAKVTWMICPIILFPIDKNTQKWVLIIKLVR